MLNLYTNLYIYIYIYIYISVPEIGLCDYFDNGNRATHTHTYIYICVCDTYKNI